MRNSGTIIFMIFISFLLFSLVALIAGMLITKKFNIKYRKIYSIFMGLSFREVLLLSTILINLIVVLYFLMNIDTFVPIGLYALVALCFVFCIFSLNVKAIITNIIYTVVSGALLWLLMIISNYHDYIGSNTLVLALIIIFTLLIIVYVIFITVREINILVSMHKINGGENGKQ